MTPPAGKGRNLSHFWEAPHRPLFLAAFFCALVTVAWWPLGVQLGLPAPRFEPAVLWHIHELLFGFTAAAIGGYLLTALPSWTGLPLVRGNPLQVLLLFWITSRLATAQADEMPVWLLQFINTGYFLWLAGLLSHQIILRGAYRKSGFVAVVLALGCAEALFLHVALSGHPWVSFKLTHSAIIGLSLLMTVIGTRAIPAFTNNWFDQTQRPDLRIAQTPTLQHLVQALLGAALTGMLVGQFNVAYGALILAGLTLLGIMCRWRTATTLSNPLLVAQHLAFLWLPIGQITIGILWFFPGYYPSADAVHAITIGAVSGLIMAIAGRAAAHQENGDMRAGIGFVLGVLMIWATTWIRLTAPLFPQHAAAILAVAAVIWALGWVVFIAGFLRAVTGPVIRPVLSGRKHQTINHLPHQTESSIL